jgi:hypothetical protein
LPTGVLRIGVEDLEENDSGFVILQGTTLYRPVTVKYGTLFVDSLPVADYDSLVYVPFGESLENGFTLARDVTIASGDTLKIKCIFTFFKFYSSS